HRKTSRRTSRRRGFGVKWRVLAKPGAAKEVDVAINVSRTVGLREQRLRQHELALYAANPATAPTARHRLGTLNRTTRFRNGDRSHARWRSTMNVRVSDSFYPTTSRSPQPACEGAANRSTDRFPVA